MNQPAFTPQAKQQVLESGPRVFGLVRTQGEQSVVCLHNVSAAPSEVELDLSRLSLGQPDSLYDLITGQKYDSGKALSLLLGSYQTIWLTNRQ